MSSYLSIDDGKLNTWLVWLFGPQENPLLEKPPYAATNVVLKLQSSLLSLQIPQFWLIFTKGMGNLKYLLPSDEGILQFLSYITEIWSRDQFFHENQLCFRSGVIFWWNKGCKRGKFLFLSDFLGVSYLQMAVIHSIFELGYSNFGNWKYSRATKTTLLCDFFICLVKNRVI